MDDDFPGFARVLRQTCSPDFAEGERAMARNLLCDHRILKARLDQLAGSREFEDIGQVASALRDYHDREVRPLKKDPRGKQSVPAYARPENAGNAVVLSHDATLATVLNLSLLGPVYQAARDRFKMPEFERFELGDPKNATEVNGKLADFLTSPARFSAILEALRRYRRSKIEKYRRLTWAAEWKSLEDFLVPHKPARWLQAVGVATETPVWVAVLRYPVLHAGKPMPLFRPTQLDAGWYAQHFPSPPQARLEKGGHTMFLAPDGSFSGYGLVNEYIHQSIDFQPQHWESASSLLDFVDFPVGGDLSWQRETHLSLLETHYLDGVRSWMPKCI